MSERLRVLMLLDRLHPMLGGAERTALRIATELPARGVDAWLATTRSASGWPLERLRAAGVRHIPAHRSSAADWRGLAPLWRTLRRERIDVIHAHMHGSNLWGTLLGRLAGTPVVVAHEHSWEFEGQQLRRVIDAAVGRSADAFVAVSQIDARLIHEYEWVPRDRIHVIPTAWEQRPATGEARDLRAELGIPAGAPVVGTVAVLRPVKRLELLVQAFEQVLRALPDAWLVIVGDGSDRERIEAAIASSGVGERVRMPGRRDDVGAVWRTFDVAAMSSDREGMPLAVLEALGHGVPMVAPAVGGIPEVLSGGGGVLVQRHDVDGLADAVTALLRDPERRARLGAEGRERVVDFTPERQLDQVVGLYRDLLAAPAARRRARRRGRA